MNYPVYHEKLRMKNMQRSSGGHYRFDILNDKTNSFIYAVDFLLSN